MNFVVPGQSVCIPRAVILEFIPNCYIVVRIPYARASTSCFGFTTSGLISHGVALVVTFTQTIPLAATFLCAQFIAFLRTHRAYKTLMQLCHAPRGAVSSGRSLHSVTFFVLEITA